MSGIVAFLLCFVGFTCLALAKGPHHRAVFGTDPLPSRSRTLRAAGALAMVGATALAMWAFGPPYGLVVMAALLNAAGLIVALLLAWPGRLAHRIRAR